MDVVGGGNRMFFKVNFLFSWVWIWFIFLGMLFFEVDIVFKVEGCFIIVICGFDVDVDVSLVLSFWVVVFLILEMFKVILLGGCIFFVICIVDDDCIFLVILFDMLVFVCDVGIGIVDKLGGVDIFWVELVCIL